MFTCKRESIVLPVIHSSAIRGFNSVAKEYCHENVRIGGKKARINLNYQLLININTINSPFSVDLESYLFSI